MAATTRKNSKKMNESINNFKESVKDKVTEILSSLGMNGTERTILAGLKKGDVFSIVGINRYDLPAQPGRPQTSTTTFATSLGGNIGCKQFIGVDMDDEDAPTIGTTAESNVIFMLYCQEKGIQFQVDKVKSETVNEGTANEYTRKTFTLSIA